MSMDGEADVTNVDYLLEVFPVPLLTMVLLRGE
jgi:hypothetical protein